MIAKFIMPGRQGGGFILTTLLGIIGAVVGGFVANLVGFGGATGFNVKSLIIAVVGALIVLVLYGLIFGRKRK